MKLKKIDLALIFAVLAIFKMEGLPTFAKNSIQIVSLILSLGIISYGYKIYLKDISLILIVPVIISSVLSYIKGVINYQNIVNCIFYMIGIFAFSNIVRIYYDKKIDFEMFRILKIIFAIFSLMNLISIFIIGIEDTGNTTYLFGGKFLSLYLLFFSFILFFSSRKKKVGLISSILSCSILTLFSIYFSCSTGIVLAISLFLLLGISRKIKIFLCNTKTLLVILIISGCLVFSFEAILSVPLISNFIIKVLGRDLTLSGRLPIYKYYLIPLISKNYIWGYGYGSSILHVTTPYWNAQNGVLDYLLNYGICGIISILVAFMLVGKSYKEKYWYLYSFMFLLLIAGIWECSFSTYLYVVLILIYNLNGGIKHEILN